MSPAIIDKCVKAIKKGLKKGEIPSYYLKEGKRIKTSPWALCKSSLVSTKK